MILDRSVRLADAVGAVCDALKAADAAYRPETSVVLSREDDDDEVVIANTLDEACALIAASPLGGGSSVVANGVRFGIFLQCLEPMRADAILISYPDRYHGGREAAAFTTSLLSRIDERLGPAHIRAGSELVSPSSIWRDLVEDRRSRK
jgi:hypothetical protein